MTILFFALGALSMLAVGLALGLSISLNAMADALNHSAESLAFWRRAYDEAHADRMRAMVIVRDAARIGGSLESTAAAWSFLQAEVASWEAESPDA